MASHQTEWGQTATKATLQPIIRLKVRAAIQWLQQRSTPAFHSGKAFGVNFLLDTVPTNPC